MVSGIEMIGTDHTAKTFHSLTHINALGIEMVDVIFIQAEHIAGFCLQNSQLSGTLAIRAGWDAYLFSVKDDIDIFFDHEASFFSSVEKQVILVTHFQKLVTHFGNTNLYRCVFFCTIS